MVIVLEHNTLAAEVEKVRQLLDNWGYPFHQAYLYGQIVFGVDKDLTLEKINEINAFATVQSVTYTGEPYHLASRKWKNSPTKVDVNGIEIGGDQLTIIAGPCAIESEEQIYRSAEFVSQTGAKFIRGGAYKPRTSPYAFQGMGIEGLKLLKKAANAFKLKIVTEVIDLAVLDKVYEYTDVLQVGSRNMHNYFFLRELGKVDKPVLLKRGMYARINEWLLSAEYILSQGNGNVILCERGIRTFDEAVRNTLDIAAVPLLKQLSHLPVIVDPSQGTGKKSLIKPLSLAAIAAGADGIMVEVHPEPEGALSDGSQSLNFAMFNDLMKEVKALAHALGKRVTNEPIIY